LLLCHYTLSNGIKKDLIAFYPLQDRKGTTAFLRIGPNNNEKATNLIRVVRDNPEDNKSLWELAALYIKESRITGNAHVLRCGCL
jgi:hypothetical protein